jgi:hypothetical protein
MKSSIFDITLSISSCAGDDELLLSGVGVIGAALSKRTLRTGELPDDGVSAVMSELWKLKRPVAITARVVDSTAATSTSCQRVMYLKKKFEKYTPR